jgi:pimeloyl-ACP methyl ester carboxylesterase
LTRIKADRADPRQPHPMRRFLILLLAAVLLTGLAVLILYSRDMAAARARLKGHSHSVETPYGRLEYATLGQGPDVLVIHGAAGGFDQGLDMTGPLAPPIQGPGGYRLIAPSRFGYLGSAMPANLTVAMQADAYVALLDALHVDKADVVAISAGAWSALQLAIRHPERVRSLTLLVPGDYLPPGVKIHGGAAVKAIFGSDFVAWGALKLMPVMPGSMSRMMLGTDAPVVAAASPSEKARVQQILDHLLPTGPRRRGMDFDVATAADHATVYDLSAIRCPVLAISDEDDVFGTAARARFIVARVKQGRVVTYPTGGHALVGRQDLAMAEVVGFLLAHSAAINRH